MKFQIRKKFAALLLVFALLCSSVPVALQALASGTDLKDKISSLSPYTSEKYQELKGCIEDYIALSAEERKKVTNILTAQNAVKALESGASFYDDFDNFNSWKIEGESPSYDSSVDYPAWPSSYEEASKLGNIKQYPFIGTHNGYLYLYRTLVKSRNNYKKYDAPVQVVPKLSMFNNNSEIISISGRKNVVRGNGGDVLIIGVIYDYVSETEWKAWGTDGWGYLCNITRDGEFITNKKIGTNFDSGWLDFSMDYDFEKQCYKVTANGKKNSADFEQTVYLTESNKMTKKTGLTSNRTGTTISFDNVSVSFFNAEYVSKIIENLPTVENVKDNDKDTVLNVQKIYNALSEGEKAKLDKTYTNKLEALINKINGIIDDEYSKMTLENTTVDFEKKYNDVEFFENSNNKEGTVSNAANPKSDAMNSSDKVLKVTNSSEAPNNIAIFKDRFLKGTRQIYSFSGIAYNSRIVYDYKDNNNWKSIQLEGGIQKGIFVYRTYFMENGVGKQSNWQKIKVASEDVSVSGWTEFFVEYSTTSAKITLTMRSADNKEYSIDMTESLQDTNQTKVGIAGKGFNATGYADDLRVNFADTAEAARVLKFKKSNKEILNMQSPDPSLYLSNVEKSEYDAFVKSYDLLSDYERSYIYALDSYAQKLKNAWDNYASKRNDTEVYNKAKSGFKADGSSEELTYEIRDDFSDGLSLFEPLVSYPGYEVSYETIDESVFGNGITSAAKIKNSVILKLKDKFHPDFTIPKEVSYKIKAADPETFKTHWYERLAVISYCNDKTSSGIGFAKTNGGKFTYCVMRDFKSRLGNWNFSTLTELNYSQVLTVHLKYVDKNCFITVTDEDGNEFTYTDKTAVAGSKNYAVIGSYSLGMLDYLPEFYVTDFRATFMKGDWDEDKTVSDINVTYTSNTFLQPGDSFVIRGSNIAENVSRVEVIPFENGTEIAGETVSDYIDRTWHDFGGVQKGEHTKEPVAPSYSAGSPAWDDISVAIGLNIVQKTTDSLKVILPTEKADGTELKHCMFALKLYDYDDDTDSGDKVIYINAPYIDYVMGVDGDSSAAGEEIRIIGENIAPDQDEGKTVDELKVRLTNKKTKATRYLDVKEVQSDYSVSVDLPHDLENGTYEVSVYNGFGDSTCWSIPSDIKVDGNIRESFPDTVYNIRDFGATGYNDQNCTPIIASALAAISKKGGGVLYFPEGVYRIEYTVYVPENITIKGDGVNKTFFLSVMYRFNYNAMPENGLFMFDSNVAFEDFQVVATRAPIFFMADSQKNDTDSVKNIYFSNVKFYWQPMAGKVTQGSSGMNMLVSNAEAQAMTVAENNHNIISFGKGYVENLQMDKLDFLNKETIQGGLFYCYNARTKYVRVTDLVSKNASYQTCISSNAIWENNVFDGGCTALQGRNIYFGNNTFRNNTTNNRELFVADHNGGICHFAQYLDKDGKWDGVTLKTVDVGLYGWGEQCGLQLFVTSGSGIGQTRKIVETNKAEGWVRVDSPFTIEVNRNSSFVYRVPREDIYFINTTFKNGFAGGFYGGASDIVYDGTKHIEHVNAAQNAQFNDVNWYFTFKDETWTYDPFGFAIETSLKKESSYNWIATSNTSADQLCFALRGCTLDGSPMSGKYRMTDLIVDNCQFNNMEYASTAEMNYVNGILWTRNNLNGAQYSSNSGWENALKKTNSSGYKTLIVLDSEYTPKNIKGDVNGDGRVTAKDCSVLRYYIAGMIDLSDEAFSRADVDNNGKVNMKDLLQIRYYVLGLIDSF